MVVTCVRPHTRVSRGFLFGDLHAGTCSQTIGACLDQGQCTIVVPNEARRLHAQPRTDDTAHQLHVLDIRTAFGEAAAGLDEMLPPRPSTVHRP